MTFLAERIAALEGRVGAIATASGRALMAEAPDAVREALIERTARAAGVTRAVVTAPGRSSAKTQSRKNSRSAASVSSGASSAKKCPQSSALLVTRSARARHVAGTS